MSSVEQKLDQLIVPKEVIRQPISLPHFIECKWNMDTGSDIIAFSEILGLQNKWISARQFDRLTRDRKDRNFRNRVSSFWVHNKSKTVEGVSEQETETKKGVFLDTQKKAIRINV